MSDSLQTFRIYIVGTQTPDDAVEAHAADPFTAAQAFIAGLTDASPEIEVAVISPNGFEDVYGYRNTVPQTHLDD